MGHGDLAQLVERTAEDFSTEKARLTVTTPEVPVPVECDPVRVVQVLSNLVSNGLKYSGPDAPVTVQLAVVDGAAVVTVADAGRGIPDDQLELVFEKFHRVEDPLRMTTGGTGLGLFIAKQLTEAMGGTLTVTSTLGTGSTFTFTLPVGTAPAPSATMPRQRSGAGPERGGRPGALLSGPNPFGRRGRPPGLPGLPPGVPGSQDPSNGLPSVPPAS
jgi:signal transduction histidine kinase